MEKLLYFWNLLLFKIAYGDRKQVRNVILGKLTL